MNLKEQHSHELAQARGILDGAKSEGRDLTAAETEAVQRHTDAARQLGDTIKLAEERQGILAKLAANSPGGDGDGHSYLSFKSIDLARRVVAKIGGPVGGVKALMATGAISTDVPLLGVVPSGRPVSGLLEVLPARTVGPVWRYLQQSVRTNNAGPVAPGATKPTTVLTLIEQTGQLSILAHISEALDNYALLDNDALRDFVSSELQYGLYAALESQLINGNGTPPNLRGLLNVSGAQTYATAAGYTVGKGIAAVRHAQTLLEINGLDSTAAFAVLNPTDWELIELGTSSTGEYLFSPEGAPVDRVQRRLFGMPVVAAPSLAAGTALVVARDAAFVLTDGQVRVEANPFAGWATNQTSLRCEGRWSLAVPRPLGVVKVTLTA